MPGLTQTYQHYCWNSLCSCPADKWARRMSFAQKGQRVLLQYSAQRLSVLEHDMSAETWSLLPVLSQRTSGSILFFQFHSCAFYNWLFTRGTHHCWLPTKAAVCASPLSLRPYHVRRLLDGKFQPLCWGLASREMSLSASVLWPEMLNI